MFPRDFPACAEMAASDRDLIRLMIDPEHATASTAELLALVGIPAPELPRVATDPRAFVPVAFPGRPHRAYSPRIVRGPSR